MTDDRSTRQADSSADATEKNRPVNVTDGNIKAAIWRNETDKGVMHNTTLTRSYQDSNGDWQETNSFPSKDLLRVAEVAREAYGRASKMDREERRVAFKEQRQDRERQPSQDRER